MGAIAAQRAPERVVNGTCTRVWAWMTNKCRRRMNGREGYITTEITQSRGTGKKKKAQRKEREAPGMREELGVPVLGRGVLSP